jgi:hypothetical protein
MEAKRLIEDERLEVRQESEERITSNRRTMEEELEARLATGTRLVEEKREREVNAAVREAELKVEESLRRERGAVEEERLRGESRVIDLEGERVKLRKAQEHW